MKLEKYFALKSIDFYFYNFINNKNYIYSSLF